MSIALDKKMNSTLRAAIHDSRDTLIGKAEKLLIEEVPKIIINVTSMLETQDPWNSSDVTKYRPSFDLPQDRDDDKPPNNKRLRASLEGLVTNHFGNAQPNIPCNQRLLDLIVVIKPMLINLLDNCNTLKMWIILLIPRIEDGNNFGVGIQEETLQEIRSVESETASYLDQISRYHITRAKLISKLVKYSFIEDYRQSVVELDEKEFLNMRLTLCEIRNNYTSLFDLISKNIEKIKMPRNSHTDTLY